MGVVKCNDCGGTVSDRIDYCPHCGAPMRPGLSTYRVPQRSAGDADDDADPYAAEDEEEIRQQRRGCWSGFIIAFLIVIVVGGVGLYWYYCNYIREPEVVTITSTLRDAVANYDELGEFYNGVAQVKRDGQIFYIDTQGLPVDPPVVDPNHSTHEPEESNLARIECGGKWGMIDRLTHDTIIKPIYSTLGNFYDGLALASLTFGNPSMPEYLKIYGYVDMRGNHTFSVSDFERLTLAERTKEKREYMESLPKGVTARALNLPDNTHFADLCVDSVDTWHLEFDRDGVLLRYAESHRGFAPHSYGVSGGYITSLTINGSDGTIRRYAYQREKVDATHEAIYKVGSEGRQRVGTVTYSPADGTVTAFTFESLPALTGATIKTY